MFGIREKEDVTAADRELLHSLAQSYQKEVSFLPLDLSLEVEPNTPVRLTACCAGQEPVTVTGEVPQAAKTGPFPPMKRRAASSSWEAPSFCREKSPATSHRG